MQKLTNCILTAVLNLVYNGIYKLIFVRMARFDLGSYFQNTFNQVIRYNSWA